MSRSNLFVSVQFQDVKTTGRLVFPLRGTIMLVMAAAWLAAAPAAAVRAQSAASPVKPEAPSSPTEPGIEASPSDETITDALPESEPEVLPEAELAPEADATAIDEGHELAEVTLTVHPIEFVPGELPLPEPPVRGVSFDIVIVPGPSLAANAAALAAFNRAAAAWESFFSDPITVTINADLANLGGGGVIGSTNSVALEVTAPYDDLRTVWIASADGDDDILSSLPTAANRAFAINPPYSLSANTLGLKAALKAMGGFGDLDGMLGALDATITFNTQFAFDYDNSNGVGVGLVDFETAAAHEIGHALGFVSSMDIIDERIHNGQPAIAVPPNLLDYLRFSAVSPDPATAADFSTFVREFRTFKEAMTDFISTVATEAVENRMSNGKWTGDGRQAGHWKDDQLTGTRLGIMDPTLPNQQVWTISHADVRALDLIGYDIVLNDCNNNGFDDNDDIAAGTSTDCNGNGTIDTCDIDIPVPGSYSASPNLYIPDNHPTGLSSTLSLPAGGVIQDVNVHITIVHPWLGDLEISLIHGGTTVLLFTRGACNGVSNFSGTVFDDEAAGAIACVPGNVGVFRPWSPLSAFDGFDVAGDWTLRVRDLQAPDVGLLVAWGLEVQTVSGDCNENGTPDECELAGNDCNGNGRHDECEPLIPPPNCCTTGHGAGCNDPSIRACVCAVDPFCCTINWDSTCIAQVQSLNCGNCGAGSDASDDCNASGIPDECELDGNDCNGTGIPDECELANVANDYLIPVNPPASVTNTLPPAVRTFNVSATGPVADVDVGMTMTHTWVSDVTITLSHGGTTVTLFNRQCGDEDNFTSTVWDDEAGGPIACVAGHRGTFRPFSPLSAFDGMEASGDWTMTVSDTSPLPGDSGSWSAWFLRVSDLCDNDCNGNGVPDECEPDCNGNGRPDTCDIASGFSEDCTGFSEDCNGDGVPDECQLAGNDCNGNATPDECDTQPLDQSNTPGGPLAQTHIGGNGQYQTFRPSLPSLGGVSIGIIYANAVAPSSTVSVEIQRGATVIASASQVVSAGFNGLRYIELPTTPVVPGETLILAANEPLNMFHWQYGGETYPNGQRFVLGAVQSGTDWVFETFGTVGDCNRDFVPDTCQLAGNDCNVNGTIDTCDIDIPAPGSYSASPNLAIPDNNPTGVVSVINVPGGGVVTGLKVALHINHNWQGDLVVTLSHAGVTRTLINQAGLCNNPLYGYTADNFGAAGNSLILDDTAATSIDCYAGASSFGINNYAGPARPNQPLSAFNGLDPAGDWTLNVSDVEFGFFGTLVTWRLDLETTSADCNDNSIPDECDLAHNCCATGHGAGCSDAGIQACVCAMDPYCCNVAWDSICAGEVQSLDCGTCGGASEDCNANGTPDECDGGCVPAATVTVAVARKANPADPGGNCDLPLLPARKSEPRSGGVTEVRVTFNVPPGGPGASPVTIQQATCAAPAFAAYAGAAVASASVAGNDLVLNFSPALENGRTYKLNIGASVTAIAGQSVEVRGLVGDVNSDGQVNALDRSVVVGTWTGAGSFSCPTDVNSSGQTNALDRSVVVGAWTGAQNCAP